LKWLAVSERTRGAVWDLESGKRVLLSRAFRSGVIANGGMLSAEFPKFRQIERQSMRVDLNRPNAPVLRELKEGAGERIRHAGEFIAVLKSDKKGGPAAVLEIQDSGTLLPVWTRSFPYGIPDLWISPRQGAVIAEWGLLDKGAQAVIKANSGLQQKVKAMKEPQGDYLLEIMDSRSGIVLGYLPVETGKGSFRITQVLVAGDWVVLGDDQNRALIYSLAAGEKKGQVFGSARAVTGGANPMLAVENEGGQLAIYDLTTLKRRDEFVFADGVPLAQFTADGRKLFVLSANQTAYVLDMSAR
jgi:hypothetical protein